MKFLSAEQFNRKVDIKKANCLAFALGLTHSSDTYKYDYTLSYYAPGGEINPIDRAFLWAAEDFGIRVRRAKKEELTGRTGFLVYGWYAFGDFHIVRQNPDGTLEHKPDWKLPATVTTLEELRPEYPEGPSWYFVLTEEDG